MTIKNYWFYPGIYKCEGTKDFFLSILPPLNSIWIHKKNKEQYVYRLKNILYKRNGGFLSEQKQSKG